MGPEETAIEQSRSVEDLHSLRLRGAAARAGAQARAQGSGEGVGDRPPDAAREHGGAGPVPAGARGVGEGAAVRRRRGCCPPAGASRRPGSTGGGAGRRRRAAASKRSKARSGRCGRRTPRGCASSSAGWRRRKPAGARQGTVDGKQVAVVRERRLYPQLVTREPAPDDADVYGPAWPLIDEWRKLRAGHPGRGSGVSWLVTGRAHPGAGGGHAG